MNKDKQIIEEMAQILGGVCNNTPLDVCATTLCNYCRAEHLYNADYRKQSEVIDEFAEMLKKEMNNLSRMEYHCDSYFLVSKAFIDKIAKKMKGGAE